MNNIINYRLFLTILLFGVYSTLTASEYHEHWLSMQNAYQQMHTTLNFSEWTKLEEAYCHDFWKNIKKQMQKILTGPPNKNILQQPAIMGQMVRTGIAHPQEYEVYYLQYCILEKTKKRIQNFAECNFSSLPRECSAFDCTSNTLGALYYAAKSLEQFDDQNINIIVELGGGYGNLARVFKMMVPDATIILIDLPEFLALQHLYLNSTLPKTEIVVHATPPTAFKKGAIHLLPSVLLEQTKISSDLFISTFALSETSEILQKAVINKNFFNSKICYISGQLSGWNSHNFVNESRVLNGVRELYQKTHCQPFHNILNGLASYELIGTRSQ
jgi:putative sugar O-methyltransferase